VGSKTRKLSKKRKLNANRGKFMNFAETWGGEIYKFCGNMGIIYNNMHHWLSGDGRPCQSRKTGHLSMLFRIIIIIITQKN